MRVEHRFFTVGGLRLHALDHGGSGPPIVLLHGVTGFGAMWRDVVGPLTLWGRVLTLDLRGHGDSQWSAQARYGTADLAADVAGVVDALGEGPAAVVGSSWGGLVALHLAASSPRSVRRVALIDSPVRFGQRPDEVPERPCRFDDHASVVAWEREANPRGSASMVEHLAAHSTRPGDGGALIRKHDPFFLRTWPFRGEDHLSALASVAVPVLVVRGAESPVLSAEHFDELAALLPKATQAVVERAGHLVAVDNPLDLADVLVEFLSDDSDGDG